EALERRLAHEEAALAGELVDVLERVLGRQLLERLARALVPALAERDRRATTEVVVLLGERREERLDAVLVADVAVRLRRLEARDAAALLVLQDRAGPGDRALARGDEVRVRPARVLAELREPVIEIAVGLGERQEQRQDEHAYFPSSSASFGSSASAQIE